MLIATKIRKISIRTSTSNRHFASPRCEPLLAYHLPASTDWCQQVTGIEERCRLERPSWLDAPNAITDIKSNRCQSEQSPIPGRFRSPPGRRRRRSAPTRIGLPTDAPVVRRSRAGPHRRRSRRRSSLIPPWPVVSRPYPLCRIRSRAGRCAAASPRRTWGRHSNRSDAFSLFREVRVPPLAPTPKARGRGCVAPDAARPVRCVPRRIGRGLRPIRHSIKAHRPLDAADSPNPVETGPPTTVGSNRELGWIPG